MIKFFKYVVDVIIVVNIVSRSFVLNVWYILYWFCVCKYGRIVVVIIICIIIVVIVLIVILVIVRFIIYCVFNWCFR